MLEAVSIGSGSCGNALLIRDASATLLIDSGVGVRRLRSALDSFCSGLDRIDALLVTHEHVDHVRELPRFVASRTPVLTSRGTWRALSLAAESWDETLQGRPVCVGAFEIVAIPVRHDAADPCGFLIRSPEGAITVLTDLGSPSGEAIEAIAESSLVVIEANHDVSMVRNGPYPPHLQRRILSDSGHLSNHQCGELLASALKGVSRVPAVWLAHLSATNNKPQVAKRTVAARLAQENRFPHVLPLPRREAGPVWRPGDPCSGATQLPLGLFP